MGDLMKKDEGLVRVSRVVSADGKVDITKLTDEEKARCREITKDIKDVESLYAFGSDLANSRNQASTQLLELNKIDKAGKIGTYINEVVTAIKESEYKDPSKMTGFRKFLCMMPFGKSLLKVGEKYIVDRFETSKDVVNKVVEALKIQQIDLKSDYNTLDNMLVKTKSYIDQLGILFISLKQLFIDKSDELDKMKSDNLKNPGTWSSHEISEAQQFLEEIDRHGYELFLAGQYNANILIPSLTKMKQNAIDLSNNSEQIVRVVIPNWEMSVNMALINRRAQEAVNLQKMVKDKNNELIVSVAEMTKDITVKLGEESRRGAYDIESYSKAYKTIKEALLESSENIKKAREERRKNLAEIEKINKENASAFESMANSLKEDYYSSSSEVEVTKELK